MFDRSLIRGFNEPELVNAHRCFHSFESLKTLKKTLGGCFFVNFFSQVRQMHTVSKNLLDYCFPSGKGVALGESKEPGAVT